MPFAFHLEARTGAARAGRLVTDHGEISTPVFMPVGTQATVKGATIDGIRETGARIILGNTYHLCMRPGVELIDRAGGLHRFMGWDGAILTDSGGYQVFSLASLRRLGDDGVRFRSHIDGSMHMFTPESVMTAQARIGADILMSFDYFGGIPCPRPEAEHSVALTTAWARRGRVVHGARFNRSGWEQVVFGIVQGAEYEDLRRRSAEEITALDFPGYAIGGLAVGEDKQQTRDITELCASLLPAERPRYLMGMGTPLDLVEGVARGVTCTTACCRRGTAAPARYSRATGAWCSRTPRTPTTSRPSTRRARVRRAGVIRARTCAISFWRARCWGRCWPRSTTCISLPT